MAMVRMGRIFVVTVVAGVVGVVARVVLPLPQTLLAADGKRDFAVAERSEREAPLENERTEEEREGR